jgi:medium-chain acyl-[acyl-carrier-protein] hydrolase
MTTAKFNAWVTCPNPQPQAKLRLFCFAFAGSGASIYRDWGKALEPTIEVCPIQLPGRENRFGEPLYRDVETLAPAIAQQLHPLLDKPYMIFGHSMGALVGYEVLRVLQATSQPLPKLVLLAAFRAAHLPLKREPMHQLNDEMFIEKLASLGGCPQEVLESKELMQIVLPILRADFEVCDGYTHQAGEALNCPLILIAGQHDPNAGPKEMQPWQLHTQHPAHLVTLPAGHFFLKTHQTELMQIIQQYVQTHAF